VSDVRKVSPGDQDFSADRAVTWCDRIFGPGCAGDRGGDAERDPPTGHRFSLVAPVGGAWPSAGTGVPRARTPTGYERAPARAEDGMWAL